VTSKSLLFGAVLLMSYSRLAFANDFFVITDTFKSQRDAQIRAAAVGGWALDTDIYSGLERDRFAVVRGPFATAQAATKELADLKKSKKYKSAYVRDGGVLRLVGDALGMPSKVLAALLGELSVDIKDMPGGANPCEPGEPYQDISLSFMTLDRTRNPISEAEGFKPRRAAIDIGGFWIIKRTGEIERMRVCAE
jgi:hypothetical protein